MRRPFWRASNAMWYYQPAGGKQIKLGHDPHGGTRKNPPPEIEREWHRISDERSTKDLSFREAIDLFLKKLEGAASHPVAKMHLEEFLAFTGDIKITKLKPFHWGRYQEGKNWSPSYARTKLNKITACLNYAVDQRYVSGHEFKISKHDKPRMEKREGQITKQEQEQLEEAAYPALRLMLAALRVSGCRPIELCRARIEQCDLKERVLLVPNKTAKSTGQKYRIIYLSEKLIEIIRESIGERTEGFIFLHSRNDAWDRASIGHAVRKLRIKLGMKDAKTPYQFRHRFASDAINEANINPAIVARLLGHRDMTMVLRNYFSDDKDAMLKAMEQATEKK